MDEKCQGCIHKAEADMGFGYHLCGTCSGGEKVTKPISEIRQSKHRKPDLRLIFSNGRRVA